ncbi:hypothetical protein EON83_04930 [bacterium]|nr:MAG: hypothetical protein EON83_04930 [bacterium]
MSKFTLKRWAITALLGVTMFGSAHTAMAQGNATVAPTTPLIGNEGLTATAWVQSSAEAKIAARQAYRMATRQLDVALKDKNWSAALEQGPSFKKLPPAIILDLDETVLDNSPLFARMARDNVTYTDEGWLKWTAEGNATAIEGAVKFLNYANNKGVKIYYISNRASEEEAVTRANLQKLGCPIQGPEDHVLLKGEQNWTSNKSPRRSFVAQNHRILLLVGDDLNDFVSARSLSIAQRRELFDKYADNWGERWVLISNPLYGSWEDSIYGFKSDLSPQEMLRLKYGVLQYREPTAPIANTTPANR